MMTIPLRARKTKSHFVQMYFVQICVVARWHYVSSPYGGQNLQKQQIYKCTNMCMNSHIAVKICLVS